MPTKKKAPKFHVMVCPPYCGKKKKGGAVPVGAIWNAIPADVKRQLALRLAKDFTTKVALPIASVLGAKKLYKKFKKK